jgi:hypothetical protein
MTSPQQHEPASQSIVPSRPHDRQACLDEQRRQRNLIGAYPRTSEHAEAVP